MDIKEYSKLIKAKRKELDGLMKRKMPVIAGRMAKDHFQDNFRQGGFVNIEAKPNIRQSAYNEMAKQGITWEERFLNRDGTKPDYDYTYKWQVRKGYQVMNANRLKEYFREKFREDGIYEIYCAWKGGSAHVFCAEVTEGKTRFFDPQTGKDDASNYIQSMKAGRVGVIRIDNKLVNPKIMGLFITK